ncbi:MAG: arginine--tRNA ligase [Dehalococcoidia bacterium]|nr:MAG: arginine--tRNA ligase [Dehalococcoidia bacterium]
MDGILEIKQKIAALLKQAAEQAQKESKLPQVALPEIIVERPQNSGHGDYASSLPLKLARSIGKNPIAIAQAIAELIPSTPELASVTVAPPGFINFTLRSDWLSKQVEEILDAGENFGDVDVGKGQSVQVEFVSANPTGPLHVGHGRGAVLGSTLANILEAAGFNVEKEYYINDAGSQMMAFYRSLYARYQQACGIDVEMPQEGYFGQYVIDLAREIKSEEGDRFLNLPADEGAVELGKIGVTKMLALIRGDLQLLGVDFDCWFSEQSLYDNGQFVRVMDILRREGHLAEKEGATWFVSTALGEDKDNVVVRSSGSSTYFGTDIAYHYNKFIERRFDRVIDIWGADHQGHVSRMSAVMGALGVDPARLRVIISQLVTLRRGGESVRVSKRSGDMITLRDVIDEVGVDACRFFFLARSADSQMDFDLELAKKESSENPVYYVQYAHARIASILRLARDEGIDFSDGEVALLTEEPELALVRLMLQLPEIVEFSARTLEPQNLPHYAQDLATCFHSFYKQCRVIAQQSPEQSKARLKLVAAAKVVLARALGLMGMTAPETM